MTSPTADSACYHVADFRICPIDSSRRRNRDLCELCFPDDEVPDHVTHFVFSGQGKYLHRSPDQGGEAEGTDAHSSPDSYSQVTSILKDEDVTTWEDARRVAGGES
ncbi:hypothetical protein ACAH01_08965 [Halomicrobium sp. HM KBTZ05]|uniref:hypothetical protein n=1 Tax=Halomicrobium sp. HM KBTZ05 TaxID=3242663 RepID=UPI003558C30D